MSPSTSDTALRLSPYPARILSGAFLGLAILSWPPLLERFVSLDWYAGNLQHEFYGLQVAMLALSATTFLASYRINRWFAKQFPNRKTLIFTTIVCFLSLIATLFVVEIGLRFLRLPFTATATPSENATAQFDPEIGWSSMPNHSATEQVGSARRQVSVHFNDIGARVAAADYRHDPSLPTAIFVGGSVTMGHGVTYEESFPGQLDSMPEFTVQVINLGVQGYGTDQALLLLKRIAPRFNTRIVVYTFICDHVRRNANPDRRLLYPHLRFLGTKPLFALRSNGSLYLKQTPRRYEGLRYSRLWAYVQVMLARQGPIPTPELTGALAKKMKEYSAWKRWNRKFKESMGRSLLGRRGSGQVSMAKATAQYAQPISMRNAGKNSLMIRLARFTALDRQLVGRPSPVLSSRGGGSKGELG